MNRTQKHQQARFLLIRPMVIWGLLVVAQTAWCCQVDSEKIDLILRDIAFSKASLFGSNSQGEADARLPSVLATIQTRQLGVGAGIKDWDKKNPKWKPIHDRIRSDLEKYLPTLPAAAASSYAEYSRCEVGKCYEQDIASNMQPADVDAILAYFDTPEGKRFQSFQQQIGSIFLSGILAITQPSLSQIAAKSPNNEQESQAKSIPLSAEQKLRFMKMLTLSLSFQSTKAMIEDTKSGKQDPSSAGEVFVFYMAAAMSRNEKKLEEMDLQYRNDLPGFKVFTETDALRHFIEAMGKADAKSVTRTRSALEGLQGIANMHQQEWKVLFKAELSQ
jgi:hypothetical protein